VSETRAAVRAVVAGRVQGVGFRDYVEWRARSLSLTGYVRNRDDHRSLEVVAEGPRESLEQLLRHLHSGPRMARVDRVDVEWLTPSGDFLDFRTRF